MVIGLMYILCGIIGGTIGFALSIVIRLELSLPSYVLCSSLQYNSNITFHGLLMIFFMIMPILIGGLGNLLVPLMLGSSDMIFPRLNAMSL
jgi:heme/copper-type cytochrome/quinol oxidase subunit 1